MYPATRGTKKRILLLSSIQPANTFGGSVLLHRHLVERQDFEVLCIGPDEVAGIREPGIIGSLIDRVRRTRFSQFTKDYEQLYRFRKLCPALSKKVDRFAPEAVLTVAHGPLFTLAQKVANMRGIPLVSIFHDWWPYLVTKHAGVSNYVATKIERRFRGLYRVSDCVMPICDGMKDELGEHPNAVVIPPIAPSGFLPVDKAGPDQTQKFIYMGNMTSGYGAMLQRLLRSSGDLSDQFRFFGNSEDWDPIVREQLLARNVLTSPRRSDAELHPYLSNARALLVTLPLDGDPEIWSRTSFPSKLVSYLQYARPIVFWGPESSSLMKWAKKNQATAAFISESPTPVLGFLNRLMNNAELEQKLVDESIIFAGLFNSKLIHRSFLDAITMQIELRSRPAIHRTSQAE